MKTFIIAFLVYLAAASQFRPEEPEPLVSVVLTSYNNGNNLAKAIESVIQQEDYSNWELIIVDEQSNDT
jgi:glycosyltransferase involved in cell wall biosynthesis